MVRNWHILTLSLAASLLTFASCSKVDSSESYEDLILGVTSNFDSIGSCSKEETKWEKDGSVFSLRHCPADIDVNYDAVPGVTISESGEWPTKTVTATLGKAVKEYTLILPDYVQEEYAGWNLVWSDEFIDDDYDRNVWSRCVKGTSDWNRCQEPEDESLVAVSDGVLSLYAKHTDDTSKGRDGYVTGGIWGMNLKSFNLGDGITSGRVDVCARMTDAKGYWPAIWMMPQQDGYSWPQWGEIDMMEHLNYGNIYYATLHTYRDGSLNKGTYTDYSESKSKLFQDRTSWHVFTVIVDSDKIRLLKDSNLAITCNKSEHSVDASSSMETRMNYWPYDATEYYLILDSQVGGGWVGTPDASDYTSPAHMDIDYVRYMVK